MKTVNVIYILRVVFGILAGLLAAFLVDLRFGDPLINGITIGLAVYLVSYYLLKWRFLNKVDKPTKILTMGIGAFFLVFIMVWVLFVTPFLSAPIANFTINITNPVVGGTIEFNGSTSDDIDGEVVKWIWNFGDDSTGDGVTSYHIYTSSGEYLVSLTVVDDHGISSTNSTILIVSAE